MYKYLLIIFLPLIQQTCVSKEVVSDLNLDEESKLVKFNYNDQSYTFDTSIAKVSTCSHFQIRWGFYELDFLREVKKHTSPDTLCLDLGANIGNHTVFFAKECGMYVAAFEPAKTAKSTLERNIALNNITDKVVVYGKAVGASKGNASIKKINARNIGENQFYANDSGDFEIVTLDSLSFSKKVHLIKADIEDGEFNMLLGAQKLLKKDKPCLFLEIRTEENETKITRLLNTLNYQFIKKIPVEFGGFMYQFEYRAVLPSTLLASVEEALDFDSKTGMPVSTWRWKPLVEATYRNEDFPLALRESAEDYYTYAEIFKEYEGKGCDFDFLTQQLQRTTFLSENYQSLSKSPAKPLKIYPKEVSMLCVTHRPHDLNLTLENFDRQKEVEKELVLVLNGSDYDLRATQDTIDSFIRKRPQYEHKIKIYEARKEKLGAALRFGTSKCSYEIITKMDADDLYGSRYLIDMMQAFNGHYCLLTGKTNRFVYHSAELFLTTMFPFKPVTFKTGSYIIGATQAFDRKILEFTNYKKELDRSEDYQFYRGILETVGAEYIFSQDIFNFCQLWNTPGPYTSLHTVGHDHMVDRFKHILTQNKYIKGCFLN